MKALILGAGYATRLYPLTKHQPKPLLPMAGRPMVEWILDRLDAVREIDRVYLVSNDTFHSHYEQWLAGYKAKRPIELVNDGTTSDANKRGAVGDLRWVVGENGIRDDLLVVAGDNLFDLDVGKFVSFFKEKTSPVVALKDFKDKDLISQYSVVTLDGDGRIVSFDEKPAFPKTTLISLCLYLFPKDQLGLLEEYGKAGGKQDQPGYYIQWLVKRTPTYGFTFDGLWFDIGDIDSYNKANAVFEKRFKKQAWK